MNIIYTIPSYQRSHEQLTLDYLRELGIPNSQIYLSVQTQEDYQSYRQYQDKVAKILYREGNNVSDNRNTILDYFPKNILLLQLDDDIKTLAYLTEDKELKDIDCKEKLEKLVFNGFKLCIRNNAKLWGIYPAPNAFYMKPKIRDKALCEGTLMGIINSNIRFNNKYPLKEDYAFTCEHLKIYKKAFRLDFITAKAKHKTGGGCSDDWQTSQENACNMLLSEYSMFVKPNTRRPNEVLIRDLNTYYG